LASVIDYVRKEHVKVGHTNELETWHTKKKTLTKTNYVFQTCVSKLYKI
jgi:hypothetical protein